MRVSSVLLLAATFVASRADQAVLDSSDAALSRADIGMPMSPIDGESTEKLSDAVTSKAAGYYERLRETSGRGMASAGADAKWCGQPWWCRRIGVYKYYQHVTKQYKGYIDAVQTDINNLRKQATELQEKTGKAKKELASAQGDIVRVKMVAETLSGVYRTAMDELNVEKMRRSKLANDAARVVTRVRASNLIRKGLNTTVHKLEEELVRIAKETSEEEHRTDKLADETSEQLEQSGKIQGEAAAKRVELGLMISEDKDQIKASDQRIKALEDAVLDVQRRTNATRAEADRAHAEYERLVAASESADAEAQDLEMRITSLESQYTSVAEERRQALDVAASTAREQQDAEDEDRVTSRHADALAEEQTFVDKVLADNKNAAAESDSELAALSSRRATLLKEMGELSNATAALRSKRDALEAAHDALRSNATAMHDELDALRESLQKMLVHQKEVEASAEKHRAEADAENLRGRKAHQEALGLAAASTVRHARHIKTMAEGLMGFCDCSQDEGACSKCGPHVAGAGTDAVAEAVASAELIRKGAEEALEQAKMAVSPSPSPSFSASPTPSVTPSASPSPSASASVAPSPSASPSASASAQPSPSASPAPAEDEEATAEKEVAQAEEQVDAVAEAEKEAEAADAEAEAAADEKEEAAPETEAEAEEEAADVEAAETEAEPSKEEEAKEEAAEPEAAEPEAAKEEEAKEEEAKEEAAEPEAAKEEAKEEAETKEDTETAKEEAETDEEVAQRFSQLLTSPEMEAAAGLRFREKAGRALRGGAEAEAGDDPLDHVPSADKKLFTPPNRWRNWPWSGWCIWRHKWCRYENYAWNLLRHYSHQWWWRRHGLWWQRNRATYQQRRAKQYFQAADNAAKAAKSELQGLMESNKNLRETTKTAKTRQAEIVKQMKSIDESMQLAYKGLAASQADVEGYRYDVEDLKEERVTAVSGLERAKANEHKAEEIQTTAANELAAARQNALATEAKLRAELAGLSEKMRSINSKVADLEILQDGASRQLQAAQSARDMNTNDETNARREATVAFKLRDERQMSKAKVEEEIKGANSVKARAKAATEASMAAIAAARDSMQATKSEMRQLRAKLERTKAAMHAAGSSHALSSSDASSVGIAIRRLQDAVAAKEAETEALHSQISRMAQEAQVFQDQMKRARVTKGALDEEVADARERVDAAGAIERKEARDERLASAERTARSYERDELARKRGLMARTPLERISETLDRRRQLEGLLGGERAETTIRALDEAEGEEGHLAKELAEKEKKAAEAIVDEATASSSPSAEEDAVEAEADKLVEDTAAGQDQAKLDDMANSVAVSPDDLPADSASGDAALDDLMGMGPALSEEDQAKANAGVNDGSSGDAPPASEQAASSSSTESNSKSQPAPNLEAAASSSGSDSADATSDLEDAIGEQVFSHIM